MISCFVEGPSNLVEDISFERSNLIRPSSVTILRLLEGFAKCALTIVLNDNSVSKLNPDLRILMPENQVVGMNSSLLLSIVKGTNQHGLSLSSKL